MVPIKLQMRWLKTESEKPLSKKEYTCPLLSRHALEAQEEKRGGNRLEKRVIFRQDNCKSCELCLEVCPKKIIKLKDELNRLGYRPAWVEDSDQELCISCALCARMCPDAVIEVFR